MTIPELKTKGLLSTTKFSAGGTRIAYDLEEYFDLPAPAETIFDLRRDNAQAFIDGVNSLLGGRFFQVFHREIVGKDTYGIRNSSELSSMYGWTTFRGNAKLDEFTFDENRNLFLMGLKNTERGPEEQIISLDGMPKFAFLNRKHPNIHFRTPAGLYLSCGHHNNPFVYRSQAVYALREVSSSN